MEVAMKEEAKYEYRFLSTWRGKKLAAMITEAQKNGWQIDWRYTNAKHCCWMKRPINDA